MREFYLKFFTPNDSASWHSGSVSEGGIPDVTYSANVRLRGSRGVCVWCNGLWSSAVHVVQSELKLWFHSTTMKYSLDYLYIDRLLIY